MLGLMGVVGFTVIVNVLEVAVVTLGQAAVVVMIHRTDWPLTRLLVAYVLPVTPLTVVPFTCHTYEGTPPFTGAAVNVSDAPAQTVLPVAAEIDTEGVTTGLITKGIEAALAEAEVLVTQVAFVVTVTLIACN